MATVEMFWDICIFLEFDIRSLTVLIYTVVYLHSSSGTRRSIHRPERNVRAGAAEEGSRSMSEEGGFGSVLSGLFVEPSSPLVGEAAGDSVGSMKQSIVSTSPSSHRQTGGEAP